MASADKLAAQGQKSLDDGDINSAAEAFNAALGEDPNHTRALVGLARCFLLGSGQDPTLAEKAAILLDRVLGPHPKDAEAVIYRGVVYEAQGQLNRARQHYERGVALDPRLFIGHFNLGRAAGQMKHWDTAVRALEEAVRIEPENVSGIYSLGIAYKESGNLPKAVETFQHFVELNPTSLDGYMTLVDVVAETGDLDAVWSVLDRARTLFGDDPAIIDRQLGFAIRVGWRDQAIDLASRLAEQNPRVWVQVSTFALNHGDYVTAQRAATSFLDIDPQAWEAYYHLGLTHDEQGQRGEAEPYYRKAIEFGRDHWQPYNNLGTNLIGESNPARIQEGVDLLLKAKALTGPEVSAPRYNLALGYYKLDKPIKAVELCREVLEKGNPEDPIVQNTKQFLEAVEQELRG
jgi:tetratricopeptide (TPR) repeat protein